MQRIEQHENILVYEDKPEDENEPEFAEADVKLSSGHLWRSKFFMGALDYNKVTLAFANLTDNEKEQLFNELDKFLHNDDETRLSLNDRVECLESQKYILEQQLEEATAAYEPEPEQYIDYIKK